MQMVSGILVLLVGGIALAQTVSDPRQVTLRWLRLGGIINVTLLGVAIALTVALAEGSGWEAVKKSGVALPAWPVVIQLLTVQKGWRLAQRLAAAIAFVFASVTAAYLTNGDRQGNDLIIHFAVTMPLAAAMLGGFLMTMLLGHAYLTAGNEMTQKPFARLTSMLAVVLLLRAIGSVVFGLIPALNEPAQLGQSRVFDTMLMTARLLVGLAVPGVFVYMVWDCVKRRANQSATGILYVAGVLVIIGEGIALALGEAF